MALISPEYVELNKQLYEERPDYGTGAFRWAQEISSLRDELKAGKVLDYGCGRGTLKAALGDPEWLHEYDPAIPGKDKKPKKQYDLVVCADVLEHVEREHLQDVLNDIWSYAKRAAFIVISTRPSSKKLADGRNAHLIVEDGRWWRQWLEQFFYIDSWNWDGNEVVAVCLRVHTPDHIKVVSAVSEDIRFENAKINIGKNKRRLDRYKPHKGMAVICCFGPSLAGSIEQIKNDKAAGGTIVTVSGAHDFLIERGIVPDIHIDIDPREHKGYFTRNPNRNVRYWMASCCHPKVIDNLLPYDLTLFHVFNSDKDRGLEQLEPDGGFILAGGGSVGCRAVNVMFEQGFRKFSLHGMDCSFSDTGEQHAAFHSGKHQEEWRCRMGDRWFNTSGTLIAIARAFIENMSRLEQACRENGEEPIDAGGDRLGIYVHGDGLLAAMIREGNSSNLVFHREIGSRDDGDPVTKEQIAALKAKEAAAA